MGIRLSGDKEFQIANKKRVQIQFNKYNDQSKSSKINITTSGTRPKTKGSRMTKQFKLAPKRILRRLPSIGPRKVKGNLVIKTNHQQQLHPRKQLKQTRYIPA